RRRGRPAGGGGGHGAPGLGGGRAGAGRGGAAAGDLRDRPRRPAGRGGGGVAGGVGGGGGAAPGGPVRGGRGPPAGRPGGEAGGLGGGGGGGVAGWRDRRFELPDYYLVIAAAPPGGTGPDLYLGPLRAARPRRVAVAGAAGSPGQGARLLDTLRSLEHGPWWPPLGELVDAARHFYAGGLAETQPPPAQPASSPITAADGPDRR